MELIILVIAVALGIALHILSSIQLGKIFQAALEKKPPVDNTAPPRFYITGDKHRDFSDVERFCKENGTRKKDVLIILGDSGFNYYGDNQDLRLKAKAANWDITLFCLHGNKENRPQNIPTYGLRDFCGGKVLYEPSFPNILFAVDGEVYHFGDKDYIVAGGAHSVDKIKCLVKGKPFWEDEMPGDEIKATVEKQLDARGHKIHGVLTHTCPVRYLPTEMFLNTQENATKKKKSTLHFPKDIDRSTENWLEEIERKLDYREWFCGHYHVDKQIDKITMMYSEIRPLYNENPCSDC